jgi:hypothetical protein
MIAYNSDLRAAIVERATPDSHAPVLECVISIFIACVEERTGFTGLLDQDRVSISAAVECNAREPRIINTIDE